MRLTLNSNHPGQTEDIAAQIGRRLKGGETIELASDLGGGKTTFVRGLARGAGSQDKVASPTFTISRLYKTNKLRLYHFDFYRLSDAGLMLHELDEVINNQKAVVIVEWGKVVTSVLPTDRLKVHIKVVDDTSRNLVIDHPNSLAYLVRELC
jgi:tRNA threonylcarbamoyladenosine biosynthesis protein TsaE